MTRLLLLLLLLLLLAPPALAQEGRPQPPPLREATIANETDRVLAELYLFAAGTAEGPDRLGSNVLPPRASLRVPLGRVRDCAWEMRAVMGDGEEFRRRFDLCRNPRVRLAETGPRREVEVVNNADADLRELYLFPPGARERGRDRLGSATVAAGESLRLTLRGPACVFDVQAVFSDDAEEARPRVDLCRAPRLAFGDAGIPTREATVLNRSRRTLRELYARAVGATPWGPDRLGAGTLEPGGSFRLRVRGRECRFDLRAVFEDDQEAVQEAVDLCTTAEVAFGDAAVGPAAETRRVTLRNGHARTVEQVFISPAEASDWGEDRLGSAVLPPGESVEVSLDSGCQVDLRIVFDTTAAEERRGIDLCTVRAIALLPGWTIAEPLPGELPAPATVPAPGDGAKPEAAPGPAEGGKPEATPAPAPNAGGAFRLRNGGALPVVAVFADAPDAPRGANRLGVAELAPGEVAELAVDACRAEVTAVFADGHEMRVEGREVCGEELGVE